MVRRKADVAPETVDKALADLAARNRTLEEIPAEELAARTETPGAAAGEVLTIDYLGKIDGVAFPNGAANDQTVEVAGTGFIPGFQDQLVGMQPEESKTISVTFPEDYGNKDLAGKAAAFDITAKKVSRAVVPAVDDEFAKKLSFEDLTELRTMMEGRIRSEYNAMSRVRLKRELLDALAEQVTFEAPQGMVDHEFDQIWQRLEAARKDGTLDEDDRDKDEATLRAEYRAIAERRVKLGLALAEIGRANGIIVTPEEMNRAKRQEASRYPGQEAQMLEFFRKYPRMEDTLRGPIFEEKVVDFVLELAKVTEETVTPEVLAQEPPVPAAGSSARPPQVALRRRVRARCQKALRQPMPRRRRVPRRRAAPGARGERCAGACSARERRRVTAGRIALSLVSPPCAGDRRTIARGTGIGNHRKGRSRSCNGPAPTLLSPSPPTPPGPPPT